MKKNDLNRSENEKLYIEYLKEKFNEEKKVNNNSGKNFLEKEVKKGQNYSLL